MADTSYPVTIVLRADGKGLQGTLKLTAREARQLERSLDEVGGSAKRSGRQMDGAARQADKFGARAQAGAKRARDSMGRYVGTQEKAVKGTRRLSRHTESMGAQFQAVGTRIGRVVRTLGLLAGLGGAIAGISSGVQAMSEFESGMAAVQAVSQPTREELWALTDQARELGATTEFTAGQAAEGMRFLGQAGFNASQQLAAIPATLDLATAASIDLATSADITSNVLSGFRMPAQEAGRMADVLASTSASANTNVNQLGEAMAYVGPVASALGIQVEGAAAAVGVLSDAGIQGSAAGTGLRRVLSSLANPAGEAESRIQAMGLTLEQVNPATNELTDIIDLLADRGLTAADALQIFGDRGGPAILALTSQSERLRELNAIISDSEGAAGEMADTMRDTLRGDVQALGSAVQELALALGEAGLLETLRSVTQFMTSAVRGASEIVTDNLLNIRLAGITTVETLLVLFEELKGGFQFLQGVTTEWYTTLSNAFNRVVATSSDAIAKLIEINATAADMLPGLSAVADRQFEMVDSLRATAAGARENVLTVRGLGEVWAETRAEVNAGKDGIRQITGEMADFAIETHNARKSSGDLGEEADEVGSRVGDLADDLGGASEQVTGLSKETQQFLGHLQELQDRLQGPQAQAQRQFIRQTQEATRLLATGRIDVETYGEALRLFHQELNEASREFETFDDWLDSVTDRMTESQRTAERYAQSFTRLAGAAVQAATGMDMLGEGSASATGGMDRPGSSDLARGLASAISASDGQDLGDSIGNALRAYGTDGITAGLQDSLADAFEQIGFDAESGSGAISVAAVALGQAVGDQTGAAVGTVLGAAIGSIIPGIGTMIGAALGGAIGGLFDGEDDPYFVFGGEGSSGPTYLEEFETHMGDVQARMRHMDESAQDELRAAFRDFDQTLASVIDSTMLDEAQAALEAWEYIGHEEGNSVEAMLQSRFDAVLGVFDDFTQQIVRRGIDLEDQMTRLASVFAIEREMMFGRGLGLTGAGFSPPEVDPGSGGGGGGGNRPPGSVDPGLGFSRLHASADQVKAFTATIEGTGDAAEVTNPALAHTLQIVDELSRPSENLAETFERLREITNQLDLGVALTGQQFQGSREDLIRFGDELSRVFGDDMERLSESLGRVYDTFFTDEERLGVQADQASAQATSLLSQAGIDVEADMLTLQGFRELWDEMFLTMGPENQALLIEAGVAVADLIDAEEQLTSARGEATRELERQMDRVFADLRGMQWSPLRQELFNINQGTQEATAALRAAGAAEEDYALVMQRHNLQIQALAGTLRASLADMRDELFGSNDIGSSMQSTASTISGAMGDIQASMIDAIQGVRDWLDSSQLDNNSPLLPQEQLDAAGSQFWDAISAAQGGDADAASQLPQLADQFLGQANTFWGTSTAEYQDIWQMVRDAMQGVADMDVAAENRPPTYGQQQSIVDATQGTQRSALEQARMAGLMIDEIGVLSRISGDSPTEIAEEMDIPIGRLIEAVTGELPDLTGDALQTHFDELVAETDAQLSTLGRIEGVLGEIRDAIAGVDFSDYVPPADAPLPSQPEPPGMATGGPVEGDGIRMLHDGEFVVPRHGALVNSGGSDPQTRALLSKIEQRLAKLEALAEGGHQLTAEQIRAIREGDGLTGQQLDELLQIERKRQRQRQPVREVRP